MLTKTPILKQSENYIPNISVSIVCHSNTGLIIDSSKIRSVNHFKKYVHYLQLRIQVCWRHFQSGNTFDGNLAL